MRITHGIVFCGRRWRQHGLGIDSVLFDLKSDTDLRLERMFLMRKEAAEHTKIHYWKRNKISLCHCKNCGFPISEDKYSPFNEHNYIKVYDRCFLCGKCNEEYDLACAESRLSEKRVEEAIAKEYEEFISKRRETRNGGWFETDWSDTGERLNFSTTDYSRSGTSYARSRTSSAGDVVFNVPVTSTNVLISDWEDIPWVR